MRFTKTISVRISGEAKSEDAFDRELVDYRSTIADMGNVYRESGFEVRTSVGDNEDQKWQCVHCSKWYFGTKDVGYQTLPCTSATMHNYQKVDG